MLYVLCWDVSEGLPLNILTEPCHVYRYSTFVSENEGIKKPPTKVIGLYCGIIL